MKFSAFYVFGGFLAGIGSVQTTPETPYFGFLFLAAGVAVFIGALFEACNP